MNFQLSTFNFQRGLLLLLFNFAFLIFNCSAVIIPLDRRIDWNPGVRGGIPVRTTIYTNLAPTVTTAQLQSALNNCTSNQVVQLTNGNYNITASLTIPSWVTLRGNGQSNTILKGASGFTGVQFIYFKNGFDENWGAPSRTLVSPTKDSTNITTSAAHGWGVGDLVLIDMLKNPSGDPPIDNVGVLGPLLSAGRESGNRPIGQLVEIKSVPTTNTATIDPPLYWSYANTPQGTEMTGLTKYAGVEDLSIDNLTSNVRDIVAIEGAVNCWLYNVELKGNRRRGVWAYNALWFTFQKCRVTGGVPIGNDLDAHYTSDRAYGFFFGPHISASLITDCIFEKLTVALAFEGCASGNVSSYNFMTNMWWKLESGTSRRFGPLKHGPHPFMNLIEGNWSGGRIRADEYFGTSSHFTSLRNRVVQVTRGSPSGQNWTIDIERRNWYWAFVGNLLGGAGGGVLENNYEYINGETAPYEETKSTIWKIGYQSLGTGSTSYDAGTLNTLLRWGNWSYRTNDSIAGLGIVNHIANVVDVGDTTIPDSYYLSSKPSWFGSLNWPPYSPAAPTLNSHTNIPAGYRYTFNADPVPDVTPPVISNVLISDVTINSAIVSWDTDDLTIDYLQLQDPPTGDNIAIYHFYNPVSTNRHSFMLTGLGHLTGPSTYGCAIFCTNTVGLWSKFPATLTTNFTTQPQTAQVTAPINLQIR